MKNITLFIVLLFVTGLNYSQTGPYDPDFDNKYKNVEVETDKTIMKDNENSENKIEIENEKIKIIKNGSLEKEYRVETGDPGTNYEAVTRPSPSSSSFTSSPENDKWLTDLIAKLHSVIMRKGIFTVSQEKEIFKNDREKYSNNLWNILAYRIELLFQNLK